MPLPAAAAIGAATTAKGASLAGALPFAGPALGAAADIFTSAFGVHESRQNRRFQRDMSNTAHQREVADLKAAGLNPLLSVNHGSSTPPGSAAQLAKSNVGENVTGAMANKQAMELQQAQIRQTNSAAALNESQARDLDATRPFRNAMPEIEKSLKEQEAYKGDVDTTKEALRARAESIINLANKLKSEAHSAKFQLSEQRVMSEFFNSGMGNVKPYIDQIMRIIRGR